MNYPNGIKKKETTVSYANRGMVLEEDINLTNKYYLENGIALIYKRPTSVTIKKVEYPNKLYTKITDGYFNSPSTTDYNGLYKGRYIDIEAKETKSKTSFPLTNIHPHQIQHLEQVIKHGGLCFLIVRFSSLNKTFLLEGGKLINHAKENKSLSLIFLTENADLITESYKPRLDYLKLVDNYIKET